VVRNILLTGQEHIHFQLFEVSREN